MCDFCKLHNDTDRERTTGVVNITTIQDGSQLFKLNMFRYECDDEKLNQLVLEHSVDAKGDVVTIQEKQIQIKY